MKQLLTVFILILLPFISFSESSLDSSLSNIGNDLSEKLKTLKIKKVVVLYVTDINKAPTVAGKYIADFISVSLVNNPGSFQVFDRENLNEITDAKKLVAEGYIDAAKAKELGRLLSVEAIIIGNYTVLSSKLKLTLKALDSENGFVVAATMKDLPLNSDSRSLLGIEAASETDYNNNVNSNRGFNHPVQSDESYNNPETVSKSCEAKNIGDYCFFNSTKKRMEVYIGDIHNTVTFGHATLEPGQAQCFYELQSQTYNYTLSEPPYDPQKPVLFGQIFVEKCKSKTFTIK